MYDYLVERIRTADQRKLIFFEGVTWSVLLSSKAGSWAGPGFDRVPGGAADPTEHSRSVFSYHYYCPLIELANTSADFPSYKRMVCDDVSLSLSLLLYKVPA